MSPRKLWPLLTSPALSLAGKLRLLAEPFVISRASAGRELHDESVASFVRRRLGRETFEQLVQPLVAGIYTADPERLSMAATMPQFLNYEHDFGSLLRATLFNRRRTGRLQRPVNPSDNESTAPTDAASGARYGLFVAPKKGMTSLIAALAARLPSTSIHLNTPVKKITQLPSGWQLDFDNPQSATSGTSAIPL